MCGFYKRLFKRAAAFVAIFLDAVILLFCGCGETLGKDYEDGFKWGYTSSPVAKVTFIDVGEGDAIYAELGDVNLLIDCGVEGKENFTAISETIRESGKEEIDYLVLTHADSDHVGGAADIIRAFPVKNAFIPLVLNEEPFPAFAKANKALSECGANTQISAEYATVKGENFFFTFLSPEPVGFAGGAYGNFNSSDMPSERERNDISAVIYLDVCGVRFLFTGDAGENAEERIISGAKAGVYGNAAGEEVNLSETDFLKVSHHGAEDASSKEFLNFVRPKNAVISTGLNYYGHPSAATLLRIYEANENCRIYRTDVSGSIEVSVFDGGNYEVSTQAG